jgi:hypothetical protein
MKKNIWIVLSFVAIVVLAAAVVRQSRQLTQMKEQLASAAEKPKAPPVPATEREISEPPAQTKPVEMTLARPTPEPSPTAQASPGPTNNFFSGLAGMMKNPQMKEMVRVQQKVMLDRQYGSLSKYLNLPAERLDALKELLADRQMAMVDSGMAMMSGSESDKKQAGEEIKAIKTDYDKKIQELLGTQDYQVFQDYEKTVNERMSVQMFKDALPATDALSDQQEDNLIAMMYQERKDLPPSSLMNSQTGDPSQLTEERIAELQKQMEQLQKKYAERAAGILNPTQLEQYTKWQQQWSAMQAAGLKMAAQMFGNKASKPPPAQGQTP